MTGPATLQRARLRDWSVVDWRGQRLQGNVFGHPRFTDGTWVTTSRLRYLNEQIGIGVTLNTVYILRDLPDEVIVRALECADEREAA